jgi:gluconate 2-dehydrogenase gamma chain
MNRRRFLTGAAAVSLAGPACRRQPASAYRTLSDAEAASLAVLCEQIIPTDQDPGARWAGAVPFIDIQHTRHYRVYRERYRGGIAMAEAIAGAKFGRPLTALSAAEQLQCAQELEREDREFFNLLVAHTMQSYYGSPRHGGNRDYVGWRMLGVPPLPVRGRYQYDLTRVRT